MGEASPATGYAEPPPEIEFVEPTPEELEAYEAMQRAAYEKHGSLGIITLGRDRSEIVVLCDTIAQSYSAAAAEETDRDERIAKFGDVWRFEQRVAQPLAEAKIDLGDDGYERATRQSYESMSLLSMMPDPLMEKSDIQPGNVMHVWARNLAFRCGQMLDEWGIPRVNADPPLEYIRTMTRFRYRGADYTKIFENTDLVNYAQDMCNDGVAPNFTGAPLDQRGYEGMSLLDWAIECNDRRSFEALVAAGADLDATGLWEDPPLVRTASEGRLWYLTKLLDAGVNPDTMGRTETALRAATSDLDAINYGGDTRAAFNLLRERGATLSFPNFQKSIWQEWGLHETRWDLILEHWDEFESDPVEMAGLLEGYLDGDWAWAKMEFEGEARQVKTLLIDLHGVCFPVGNTYEMERDERGFLIQSNCPE
ncbi:MAG: hypothetical protein AAGK02_06380 [Pseudomonadota bacterium]